MKPFEQRVVMAIVLLGMLIALLFTMVKVFDESGTWKFGTVNTTNMSVHKITGNSPILVGDEIDMQGNAINELSGISMRNMSHPTVTLLPSANTVADFSLVLPSSAGDPNQVLTTSGSTGLLSWASPTVAASLLDTHVWVGDASNVAVAVLLSGGITMTNSGVVTLNSSTITNVGILTSLESSGDVSALSFTLRNPSGNTITIISPPSFVDYSLVLPTTDGNASQVLTTDGSGGLSWTSPMTNSLSDGKIWVGNASNLAVAVFLSGGITMSNTGVVTLNTSSITSVGTLTSLVSSGDVSAASFTLRNGSGNTVTISPSSSVFANYSLVLPTNDGNASQVLTTDGSGGLSWTAPSFGYAKYVQSTVSTNGSVPVGSAIMYNETIPAGVYNTIGITTSLGPGSQGTAFNLPLGVYTVDWENSTTGAGSTVIYQGNDVLTLAVDTKTIAGATTGTTWIHGRAIITSSTNNQFIIVSSHTGTMAIPNAGNAAGFFTARITFLKIA
jgi:hypothetical protein